MNILARLIQRLKGDPLARQMAQWQRRKAYTPLPELKSILFLWVAGSDDRPVLRKMHEVFPDTETKWLCYLPDEFPGVKADNITYVKTDDLGLGKKGIDHDLFHLLERPFDLLIDITKRGDTATDFILEKSQAKCKIGMEQGSDENDIRIAGVTSPIDFIDETARLLTNINKY